MTTEKGEHHWRRQMGLFVVDDWTSFEGLWLGFLHNAFDLLLHF